MDLASRELATNVFSTNISASAMVRQSRRLGLGPDKTGDPFAGTTTSSSLAAFDRRLSSPNMQEPGAPNPGAGESRGPLAARRSFGEGPACYKRWAAPLGPQIGRKASGVLLSPLFCLLHLHRVARQLPNIGAKISAAPMRCTKDQKSLTTSPAL